MSVTRIVRLQHQTPNLPFIDQRQVCRLAILVMGARKIVPANVQAKPVGRRIAESQPMQMPVQGLVLYRLRIGHEFGHYLLSEPA